MKKLILTFSIIICCLIQNITAQKNILQLAVGLGGSDGVDPQSTYEFGYKRKVSKVVSFTLQYVHISGEGREITSSDGFFVGTRYLGPKNKSTNGVQNISQSYSYYAGIELGIVRTTNSTLYLLGGTRLISISKSRIIGGGSFPDNIEINLSNSNSFGLEMGIGYERRFTKNYSLGGKFVIGPSTSFFGASLTAGVYF